MKLKGNKTPYSSVVGGGLTLNHPDGSVAFNVMICGTSNGISREQDEIISQRICDLINEHGLILSIDLPKEG